MPSNHLFLCSPLLFLPSIFPALGSFPVSQLFTSGGQSVRGFSFSISLSNEYSGLIALGKWPRVDGFTVQGTLKSLLQHHRLKASIFQCSVFFMVHLSHLWASLVTAGKESACNVGDLSLIPGLGISPGEGKGYPLQYSGLENSMDCMIHEVAKSWKRLGDFHFLTSVHYY